MNITALKVELTDDPLGRAYSGMSDTAAATSLNEVNRFRNRTTMTGSEILNAVDVGEWTGLSNAEKQTVWDIVHLGEVNPFGVEATLVLSVFSAPDSPTIAALIAVRKESVSRATELGLAYVYPGDVENARM